MISGQSKNLFDQARRWIPGGVNSPVRAFGAVGGTPRFIRKGTGPYLEDVDDRRYVDYVLSWGPLILGHAHPEVVAAAAEAVGNGSSFGAPTEAEVQLARRIVEMVPSVEMVRLVNSGTEATMSALRLARAFTERDKVVKFEGCYHGHGDSFLIKGGSGTLTFSAPSSPGVPGAVAGDTLTAHYNHLDSVEALFGKFPTSIAAVIVEPVAGNMGCIPPVDGFLEGLREMTTAYGSLLIFDEVMTGFRVGPAQEKFGVSPDITTLGKVIGGGFPIGAFGGRKDIMSLLAPEGPVYQAGTLSGNPVAVSAGLKTLELISGSGFYRRLFDWCGKLVQELTDIAQGRELSLQINRSGSMFSLFFSEKPVMDYRGVLEADKTKYARMFTGLLEEGIYFPPSPFESLFTSSAHDQDCLDQTLEAFDNAVSSLSQSSGT
ncbi:MAG: glutamate-1-semialdehyde 2,1-aminomutase [Fidelibacterota bacterium]